MNKAKYEIIDKNGNKLIFKNNNEFINFLGISKETLRRRIKKHMTAQEIYEICSHSQWNAQIITNDKKEKQFYSQQDLANEIGISIHTLRTRLQTMTPQEAYDMGKIKKYWSAEIILKDGSKKIFHKKIDLANEIGISKDTLFKRLTKKGMTPQEAYDCGKKNNVEKNYDKIIYNNKIMTKTEFANYIDRDPSTVMKLLKSGKTPKDIANISKKEIKNTSHIINGKIYTTKEIANELNITTKGFLYYLRKGLSAQEAYDKIKNKNNWCVNIKLKSGTEKQFTSMQDLVQEMEINYNTLNSRLKRMSYQEAYDLDYMYVAFKFHSSSLKYFCDIFNFNYEILRYNYNKFKNIMSLEAIIIQTKLEQKNPEICIDSKKGVFQPIGEFAKERNISVKDVWVKINDGVDPNTL